MSSLQFKDKVIAITGGCGGIGFALATLLAQRGALLSLADNQRAPLDEAGRKLAAMGVKVMTTVVDVRDTAEVDAWIADTVKAFGRLDGAANLAGILRRSGPVTEIKDDEFDLVMDINVKGVMKCMRAEIKAMESTGGNIVNAASTAGQTGSQTYSAYCASKHAVIGLTRVAAKEYAKKGIRVNAICPSIVNTSMIVNERTATGLALDNASQIPIGRLAEPEEIAKHVAFLLSEESTYMTGTTHSINGGMITV